MHVIDGKKALVTGAAEGIGRAISLQLAREGADLFLLDINDHGLSKVVCEAQRLGVEAIGRRCDVSQPHEITAAVQDVLDKWGELDILINNAGVCYYGPTVKMTAEQWDWLLAINLHAPIQFTRMLLPVFLQRTEAHILNVASICGLVAGGRYAAYQVSKFGLVGLTEALRAEFGRQGLGVTVVCPGPVTTNFFRSTLCGRKGGQTPEPPRWLCATPERVAAKAIRAIYRDRRLVLVTPLAYLLYNSKRLAPGLIDSLHRIGRPKWMKQKREIL